MNKSIKLLVCIILVLFTYNSQGAKENENPKFIIICEINSLKDMIVTPEKLHKFLNDNNLINYVKNAEAKFTNFKVLKKENKHYQAKDVYYLFVRDNQTSQTFAFELSKRLNKLIFTTTSTINICECKQKDETAFIIDNSGYITGCTEGNHTVLKSDEKEN